MTFARKLMLLALLPLALAQVVTIYAVMRTVERDVDDRARESLRIGAAVVNEYLEGRNEQLRTSVQVLAADFGLKEAAATGDAATIVSVLRNHGQRVDADIALLLDLEGRVVASTESAPRDVPASMTNLIDAEPQRTVIQSTAVIGDQAYQALAVPVRAPVPIAWVVLGFQLDEALAGRLEALTGLGVALVADDGASQVRGVPGPTTSIDVPTDLLPSADSTADVYIVEGTHTNYLATKTRFTGRTADTARVDVVLLRSITDAMLPYDEARQGLVLFGAALLVVVALAGVWLARSIGRPINVLTDAARRLKAGDYDVQVRVDSDDEVGELAASFNAMTTAIAEREEHISYQAMHDALTGLPNHPNITRQLERQIATASKGGTSVFAVSMRLGRMSSISSTLGHSASDQLVERAARLLRANLDPEEVLGCVGSEEFVLLIPEADTAAALECAEKLSGLLAAGVTLGNANISLRATFGIAAFPDHGSDAAGVLRKASIARSEAESGDDQVAIYRPGREDYHVRQLRIVNDLRGACHREELQVVYQPKITLPNGMPCGVEALVRWEHPEYGWLAPDEFIPAAEEAGTIVQITRYVLRKSIAQCWSWQEQGHLLDVSINISARDLCDDYLPYYVLQLLKEHQVAPERVTLEVTESSVMQQLARAITVLECLRDIGVRVSMDDFGTGQSSLAQLRTIPLDELKIDKSFVMSLPDNTQNAAIVRTTLQLAQALELSVVAEGVEQEAALRFLSGEGCQQVQGFFLSKPLPVDELAVWLGGFKPAAWPDRRSGSRPFASKAR